MTTIVKASTEDLSALHRSVDDGSLELLYQPEVELDSGALVAMEGLLRWHHGDLGVLAPPSFLDLAERSGDIGPIGYWVLREGAREARRWADLPGPQRRLWLNISTGQLTSPDLVGVVREVIAEFGLADGRAGPGGLRGHRARAGRPGPRPARRPARRRGGAAVDDFTPGTRRSASSPTCPSTSSSSGSATCAASARTRARPPSTPWCSRWSSRRTTTAWWSSPRGSRPGPRPARLTELGCDRAHGWLFASAQRADRARWLLSRGTGWRGHVVSATTRAQGWLPQPRPAPERAAVAWPAWRTGARWSSPAGRT
jgi:EAL domain-containing protein (putative c-di-GMP-specific phosphodiesterase class I)